ncbi:MAG: glycine--tRNA ligase [Desulfurococcaceae archaeon]
MTSRNDIYDKLIELAKKRGIFWNSFEIYGGVAGFYDLGPIGVLIKRNIIDMWLRSFVYSNELVVEIETPMINPRIVFEASGHEEHFTDPVLECSKCGRIYRADHLIKEVAGINVEGFAINELKEIITKNNIKCPECGGEFNDPFSALLLFRTEIGPYKGEVAYLRPEHAQGMFINFANILRITRNKLPIGIAQVGKVARNEISPRQGLLRLREFTIMEFEFFFDPSDNNTIFDYIDDVKDEKLRIITVELREKGIEEPLELTVQELIDKNIVKTPWLAYWMGVGNVFLKGLGIPDERIRFVEKLPHERAHYSAQTFDQEVYTLKYGWIEVAGYAYRTTYDLERHMKHSNADLTYFRKYDVPVEKTIGRAYPNPAMIREIYREKFNAVMDKLSRITPEEVYEQLMRKGYVEIEDIVIPSNCFYVKSEKVKIYGEKIIPHVVEPSFGLERLLYVVIENAYTERDDKVVLKLPKSIAPYHVAVFPLVTGNKPEHRKMVLIANEIYKELVSKGFRTIYDESGSIGRRYARSDEIGIPYAITVDYQTLEDNTVTVRDRDTTLQERISRFELINYLRAKFNYI